MLDAIAGPDDRDRHSLPAVAQSFLAACEGGIAGLSVAWSPDLGYARVDPEVADLCAAAAERFESFGGHVEVVSPSWDDPEEMFRITVGAEMWSAWGERLEADGEQMDRSLRALLRFGSEVTAAQYLRAMRRRSGVLDGGAAVPGALRPADHAHRRGGRRSRSASPGSTRSTASRPRRSAGRRSASRSTSPASPRPPSRWASRARGCRWGCRSSAAATPITPCWPPPPPSRPRSPGRIAGRPSTDRARALRPRLPGRRGGNGGPLPPGRPRDPLARRRVPLRHAARQRDRLVPHRPRPGAGDRARRWCPRTCGSCWRSGSWAASPPTRRSPTNRCGWRRPARGGAAVLYVGTHHRAVLRGLPAGHRGGPPRGRLGLPGNFFLPLLRFHDAERGARGAPARSAAASRPVRRGTAAAPPACRRETPPPSPRRGSAPGRPGGRGRTRAT